MSIGVTGTAQVVRQAYGDGLNPLFESDSFVGYAFPAVVDLFGDGLPELLWGHCGYLNAVLAGDGQRIWQTPIPKQYRGAIADGSGRQQWRRERGVAGFDCGRGAPVSSGGRRGFCWSSTTGYGPIRMWSPAMWTAMGATSSCLAVAPKLICVEQEEGTLRRAWTLEVEGRSSDIALADVDGDSFLDAVVTTTDGYVKAYMGEAAAHPRYRPWRARRKKTHLQPPYPNPIQQPSAYRLQRRAGRKGAARGFRPDWTAGVKTLVAAWHKPGTYRVRWDAEGLASGVYLVRLQTGDIVQERKVSLIK